jgi:hypothetical protein
VKWLRPIEEGLEEKGVVDNVREKMERMGVEGRYFWRNKKVRV